MFCFQLVLKTSLQSRNCIGLKRIKHEEHLCACWYITVSQNAPSDSKSLLRTSALSRTELSSFLSRKGCSFLAKFEVGRSKLEVATNFTCQSAKTLTNRKLEMTACGRPSRPQFEVVRAKIWLAAVLSHGAFSSVEALERHLEPELTRDGKRSPGKYRRFRCGTRSPSAMLGKRDPVQLAELAWPGTAFFFRAPLWKLLGQWAPATDEADRELQMLSVATRQLLLAHGSTEVCCRRFSPRGVAALAKLDHFDALNAVAILLARAEAAHGSSALRQRNAADSCYEHLKKHIRANLLLSPFADELFAAIERRFPIWIGLGELDQPVTLSTLQLNR